MTALRMTLDREDDGGTACSKCAALVREAKAKKAPEPRTSPATYTLRDGLGNAWRVCTNHAAAASHGHRIPPFYNPALRAITQE